MEQLPLLTSFAAIVNACEKLPWMKEAVRHVGLKEIHGRQHAPQIQKWLTLIGAPWRDDETPWCSTYVCGVLESVGIKSWRSAYARSGLNWKNGGISRDPVFGAIVIFERGPKSGHVGFVVGVDKFGNIMVLGGNQGDMVSVKPFPRSRVLGYRFPLGFPLQTTLPLIASSGKVSTNEA